MVKYRMVAFYLFSVILLFEVSCSSPKMKNAESDQKNHWYKNVNVELLENVYAQWREVDVAIIRYQNPTDSTSGYSVMVRKSEDSIFQFRYSDKWVNIDSLYSLLKLDSNQSKLIRYAFKEMCDNEISNIGHDFDHKAIFFTKGEKVFYYIVDSTFFISHPIKEKLINLDRNWWVEK